MIVWVLIAVWLVRLGLGLDHLSRDQIGVMLICGPVGGLAGWWFPRAAFARCDLDVTLRVAPDIGAHLRHVASRVRRALEKMGLDFTGYNLSPFKRSKYHGS